MTYLNIILTLQIITDIIHYLTIWLYITYIYIVCRNYFTTMILQR
jgi:hypothetical protein